MGREMESVLKLLSIVFIVILAFWGVYYKLAEKKTDKEKPKIKPTPLFVKSKKLIFTDGTVIFVAAQLAGLRILPIAGFPLWIEFLGFILGVVGVSVWISGRMSLGTNWAHANDYQIKHKQILITTGIYRYIRHPLYIGLFLIGIGAELLAKSYLFILFFIILLNFLYRQAKKEENLLLEYFGLEYKRYMSKSKMFIPFLI